MTEAQGWWEIVELGVVAIAALLWIIAYLSNRGTHRVP